MNEEYLDNNDWNENWWNVVIVWWRLRFIRQWSRMRLSWLEPIYVIDKPHIYHNSLFNIPNHKCSLTIYVNIHYLLFHVNIHKFIPQHLQFIPLIISQFTIPFDHEIISIFVILVHPQNNIYITFSIFYKWTSFSTNSLHSHSIIKPKWDFKSWTEGVYLFIIYHLSIFSYSPISHLIIFVT